MKLKKATFFLLLLTVLCGCTAQPSNDTNNMLETKTYLYSYYYDVNETHNMLNWVNEEGYTHATIRCEAYSVDDYHGAWFGGYWYPDI